MLFQGLDIFMWKNTWRHITFTKFRWIHKQDDLWCSSFTAHFHADWEQFPPKDPIT